MKRVMLLAAMVGGLTLAGFSATAKADGWGHGGWGGGGRGHCHGGYGGWGGGYGGRGFGGYGGYRGYGYSPYAGSAYFVGGPRFGIGITSGYGYGNPYNPYGSVVYPPAFYGW